MTGVQTCALPISRLLAPEAFRVRERTGVHLVIAAVVLKIHGVSPGATSSLVVPGLCPGYDDARGGDLFVRHCHLQGRHFKAKTLRISANAA